MSHDRKGKLAGKVAVITGAGSGIGRGVAERFASEGARLILVDLAGDRVAEVAKAIDAQAVVADVTSEADIGRVVEAAKKFGRLDVLVNNAGVMDRLFPLHEVTDELWEKVLATNLTGPFRLCRRAIPLMMEQKSGAIVNVASVAGLHGGRAGTAYTASKHGVVGLTRSLAWYYGPQGIRTNAVCPGMIETPLLTSAVPSMDGLTRMQPQLAGIPRAGTPAEVASVITFLASDDATYVNGAIVTADSGWSTF